MYQPTNVSRTQTGVLNAIWIGLGELSNSGWQKWLVAAVAGWRSSPGSAALAWNGRQRRAATAASAVADRHRRGPRRHLLDRLLFRGLGGFRTTENGEVVPETISSPRPAVQQHVADGGADLDPDRLRHGDLLVGDQGRAHRVHRGGPHRRGDRIADVLADHAAADPADGRRRRDDADRRRDEGLRHRLRHDRTGSSPPASSRST